MTWAVGRGILSANLLLIAKGAATGILDIESSFEEKD